MAKYIGKRFLYMVLTLFIIATITFFLMHSIPGDPFTDTKKLSPEIIANLNAKYGLDKPLIVQYGTYLKNLSKGDLGLSLKYKNRTINSMLAAGFPASARLGLSAVAIGLSLGLTFGIIAALHNKKFFDYLVIIIAVLGVAVPSFVFAGLFQYWFGVKLGWFPVAGWKDASYMVLPVLALGLRMIAFQARMMKTNMIEVMGMDYIKTAKAKGLSKGVIIRRHVIRNAILPVITVLGPLIAGVVMGSFVIEQVFGIPGMGKYFVTGVQQYDYTMILGTTIFYAALLIVMIFIVDIAYAFIDPRIKLD